MTMQPKPSITIFGGPNGAGKSTLANALLPKFLGVRDFVNADTIARGLSAFAPETVNIQAARLMLKRLNELLEQRADFAFESTLASRSFVPYLQRAQGAGYAVRLFYIWVPSADISVSRVAFRVLQGGHSVPEADIRRRYKRSISNMLGLYLPLADEAEVYHNTKEGYGLVAVKTDNELSVKDAEAWKCVTSNK